ncbi:MAG: 5-fold beta-flower protein, partial [Alphaproteobacteria bacterium]
GRLNFDRSLVNSSNSQIGLALGQESVINEPCKIIGQITAEGKAVDTKGAEIGCVDFEGLVKDKNGKRLGRIVQKGQIRGPDDQMIGKIVSNGEALGAEGNVLGCFSVDGAVLDKNKKILGVAADMKYAVDDQGKIVAHILGGTYGVNPEGGSFAGTLNGQNLTGTDNKQLGVLVPAGRRVIAVDGKVIGTVLPRGRVHDDRGEEIGYVTSSMRVLTGERKFLGRVVPFGEECKDGKNKVVGTVHFDGTIVDERKQVLGRLLASGQALDNAGAHLCMITLMSTNDDGSLFPKGLIGKMVYGPDGKPLGVVGADGFIRDANGNIIGRVLPDGTVIDLNGNVIGKAYPKGAVFSPDGKFLGIVDADGYLRDENGNIIGRMLPDGTVVDMNGNIIGRALMEDGIVDSKGNFLTKAGEDRLVYDENGNVIGRVLPDGTVVDLNGNVIGKMLPDGTIVDANGKVIGRAGAPVQSKNVRIAVGRDGKFLGIVGEDGFVRDENGNIIGRVLPDGTVVDLNGNVIGSVIEGEPLRDENGNIIGIIMPDGRVVDLDGNVIGRINANGEIVDADGTVLGTWRGGKLTAMSDKLQQKRFAFDKDGRRIGMIMPDGTVVDENGNIIGRVDENGNVIDLDGNIIGTVTDPSSAAGQQGSKGDKKDDRVSIFGTFDPDNYRYRGKTLGSGGGVGKGERYDPARIKQLRALQMAYRRQIRPGRGIGIPSVEEDLMKKQKRSKSWKDLGVLKNVSSYRVNMDNMILADKAIPAVLVRSIDTEQEDIPISAVVERNIYSESGRKIIIPAGSRIIGELTGSSASEEVGSASKVEIKWTRLIRPDGAAFQFEEGSSGDASGRAGVGAYMDRQLMKKYGLPIVQSTISSAILYAMATNDSAAVGADGEVAMSGRQQAAEDARTRFSDTMQLIFDSIIGETEKLKTRLFVPAGTRITVFARSDLWLRSSVEDEDADSEAKADLLIDPEKDDDRNLVDENARGGLTDGTSANQNAQNAQNDPNNVQQQQQIYYNNYAGQPMPQQQQPAQGKLIDSNKNKQQPPAPPPVMQQEKKEEPVDPVPELF